MTFQEADFPTANLYHQGGGARVVAWGYALRRSMEASS